MLEGQEDSLTEISSICPAVPPEWLLDSPIATRAIHHHAFNGRALLHI